MKRLYARAMGGDADLIELDDALTRIREVDDRKAQLIELQYFADLMYREMPEVTGLWSSTNDREWQFAHTWLK